MSALPQRIGAVLEACQHGRMQITRRTIAGGRIQVVKQCMDCGTPVGSALPHSSVHTLEGLPAFDVALLEKRQQEARLHWETIRAENERARAARREEYSAYLLTPEWRAKRAKALERDGYTCQGCLERRATQVHHTTYSHLGAELMFQLISLCDDCHEWLHAEDRSGA